MAVRGIHKLTEKRCEQFIKRMKGSGRPKYLNDGGGLYLHASASGAKSWIFRWSRERKSHDMGLGTAGDDDVTLAEARELATDARRRVREGGDPIEDRRAKRNQKKLEVAKAISFRQCAEAYIKAHQAGWSNPKHAAQWPATLTSYAYPMFGELPVQAVDVALVMKAVSGFSVQIGSTAFMTSATSTACTGSSPNIG